MLTDYTKTFIYDGVLIYISFAKVKNKIKLDSLIGFLSTRKTKLLSCYKICLEDVNFRAIITLINKLEFRTTKEEC